MSFSFKIGTLNLYDILSVCLFMVYLIKKAGHLKLPNTLITTTVTPGIMILSTIVVKIVFYGESTNYNGVYILFKLVMVIAYYFAISEAPIEKVNYEIVLFVLTLPLLLNIIMYMIPTFNDMMIALYHVEPFPTNERFGGIYGDQVANLGLYAAMVVVFSVIMYKEKRIHIEYAFTSSAIALFNVILCGTRSGIIACIIAYILLSFIEKVRSPSLHITRKHIITFAAIIMAIIVLIPVIRSFFSEDALNKILARFSLSRFIADITITDPSKPSNLTHALNFLNVILNQCRNRSFLFGYDTIVVFNDSFYPYIFLKYGVIGLFSIAIIICICYSKIARLCDREILLFWLLFGVIIAIKGIFPMDSKFLFFTVFWVVYYLRTRYSVKNVLNQ